MMAVFIDIDLTLIDIDGNLLPEVSSRLQEMRARQYDLIAWSQGGKEYADKVLKKHKLKKYFSAVVTKPRIIIDDAPDNILKRADVLTVTGTEFWDKQNFWNKVFQKKVY